MVILPYVLKNHIYVTCTLDRLRNRRFLNLNYGQCGKLGTSIKHKNERKSLKKYVVQEVAILGSITPSVIPPYQIQHSISYSILSVIALYQLQPFISYSTISVIVLYQVQHSISYTTLSVIPLYQLYHSISYSTLPVIAFYQLQHSNITPSDIALYVYKFSKYSCKGFSPCFIALNDFS